MLVYRVLDRQYTFLITPDGRMLDSVSSDKGHQVEDIDRFDMRAIDALIAHSVRRAPGTVRPYTPPKDFKFHNGRW